MTADATLIHAHRSEIACLPVPDACYARLLYRHSPPLADLVLAGQVQIETIRVNVLGMLNLADLCHSKGIHLTTYATGCIFHYDKDFPENSGKGFKEGDKPNFTGSYYSYTKACIS